MCACVCVCVCACAHAHAHAYSLCIQLIIKDIPGCEIEKTSKKLRKNNLNFGFYAEYLNSNVQRPRQNCYQGHIFLQHMFNGVYSMLESNKSSTHYLSDKNRFDVSSKGPLSGISVGGQGLGKTRVFLNK